MVGLAPLILATGLAVSGGELLCLENRTEASILAVITFDWRASDVGGNGVPYAMPLLQPGERFCFEHLKRERRDYSVFVQPGDAYAEQTPVVFPKLKSEPHCTARSSSAGRLVVTRSGSRFNCEWEPTN
jgi:hypothetical protein